MASVNSARKRLLFTENIRTILWIVLTLVALVVVFWLISRISWPDWTGFNPQSLWDVLELVFVPFALAVGVYWLNRQQRERELEIASEQRQGELEIASEQKKHELEIMSEQKKRESEIADDQKKETALQRYIDRMTDILLKYRLQEVANENTEYVRSIVQARTSTVLRGLDDLRRGVVVRFLQDAALIKREHPIVVLKGAYLMDVVLTDTSLTGANMAGALLMGARLTGANLTGACLAGAYLTNAHLMFAKLDDADLTDAKLEKANLVGVTYNDKTIWPRDFAPPINFKQDKV